MMSDRVVKPSGFIVGMSRSGTKWLSMCLNQHPDVAVFGETGFWGKDYVQPENGSWTPEQCRAVLGRMPGIRGRSIDEEGLLHVRGQATAVGSSVGGLRNLFAPLSREIVSKGGQLEPEELFDLMCTRVADESKKTIVLEKTPHHINWIERIHAAYSDARYIVMCREPYEFMRSYKHQGDRKDEEIAANYRRMYHPIGCALVYRGYARAILAAQSLCPNNILMLPLGAVKDDTRSALNQVFTFLNVPFVEDCVLPPVNTSFPGMKKELDEVDVLWMNWIAGREIRKLGYRQKKSHASVKGLVRTFSAAPRWAIDVWKHLTTHQNASVGKYIMRWLR